MGNVKGRRRPTYPRFLRLRLLLLRHDRVGLLSRAGKLHSQRRLGEGNWQPRYLPWRPFPENIWPELDTLPVTASHRLPKLTHQTISDEGVSAALFYSAACAISVCCS